MGGSEKKKILETPADPAEGGEEKEPAVYRVAGKKVPEYTMGIEFGVVLGNDGGQILHYNGSLGHLHLFHHLRSAEAEPLEQLELGGLVKVGGSHSAFTLTFARRCSLEQGGSQLFKFYPSHIFII